MHFNLLDLNGCVMNFLFIAILNERSMPRCRVYDQLERQHDNKTNGQIVWNMYWETKNEIGMANTN